MSWRDITLASLQHVDHCSIQQALGVLLRVLDSTVGRALVSTFPHVARQPDEHLRLVLADSNIFRDVLLYCSGERKPKVSLLKTCLAALPRIMPTDIGRDELVEIISRLTINVDSELPK